MTTDKRYAPELTRGPTNPVEIRTVYDEKSYRCEVRECGRFIKGISGDFLESDFKTRNGKIRKLTSLIDDQIQIIVGYGSGDIMDYTINVSFQPVLDICDENVIVRAKDS